MKEKIEEAAASAGANGSTLSIQADVTKKADMDRLLRAHAPEILIHTAASKHLPLVERQPLEGVVNNLLATRTVAELADAHRVATFVFLSTDKAAAPISVMGATKRAAEQLCQDLATRSSTRFVVVRFGNVVARIRAFPTAPRVDRSP